MCTCTRRTQVALKSSCSTTEYRTCGLKPSLTERRSSASQPSGGRCERKLQRPDALGAHEVPHSHTQSCSLVLKFAPSSSLASCEHQTRGNNRERAECGVTLALEWAFVLCTGTVAEMCWQLLGEQRTALHPICAASIADSAKLTTDATAARALRGTATP